MARLEDLLTEVEDGSLRGALADEVKRLKKDVGFGLVFERHLPESVLVDGSVQIKIGDRVRLRKEPKSKTTWAVSALAGKTATLVPTNGAANGNTKARRVSISDVRVVRDFGEPVYPGLASRGEIRKSDERPYHTVINGENYHAIQALIYAYEGQVDCLFLDPPYNTGARDWRYNNDYVDSADSYRHSKWLSFMEKRLRLAKRLLNDDGVLVITIDEHEVSHLGVLLEQLFPELRRQMVTVVINPKGVTQGGLSRVEEHAFVCYPEGLVFEGRGDDLLTHGRSDDNGAPLSGEKVRWQGLLHSGEGARRQDRPNMFYPVLIDEERGAIIDAGESLLPTPDGKWPEPDLDAKIDGHTAVWPIRSDGSWGRWYLSADTLRELAAKGYVALGRHNEKRRTWAISYLYRSLREQIDAGLIEIVAFDKKRNVVEVRYLDLPTRRIKTVWHRSRHDAGAYGADLLGDFLGARLFPFPKSLYAVRDMLASIVAKRPSALIVDFFAGSGTTLHATLLLNALDDGRRRCVLVTNNEVEADLAAKLNKKGMFVGDVGYDKHGIFEAVTKPRCEAAITGDTPQSTPVKGKYLDSEHTYADGFDENCEFLRLDYLEADDVELGRCFESIHPLLWMRAGSRGRRPKLNSKTGQFAIVEECGYAVLFDETALREFVVALNGAPGVEHVFLVTDSEDSFAEMCGELGPAHRPEMLYRDYARAFRSFVSVIP